MSLGDTIDTELGFPVEILERLELRGIHDLTRLKEREPWKFKAICWLLAHDVPVRDVCECASVSPVTVQLVMADPQSKTSAVTLKSRLLDKMKMTFRLGIEKQMELAKEGKLSMLDLKLLFDMIQLLEGGPTARVEHVADPELEELKKFLSAGRADLLSMVPEAETILPIGGLAPALPEPREMAPIPGLTDSESFIQPPQSIDPQ